MLKYKFIVLLFYNLFYNQNLKNYLNLNDSYKEIAFIIISLLRNIMIESPNGTSLRYSNFNSHENFPARFQFAGDNQHLFT